MNSTARNGNQRRTRYRVGVGWMIAASLPVMLLLLNEVAGRGGYLSRRQQLQKIQTLTQQIDQLKTENLRLSDRIDGLRSNPATIEEMAREQLHLGRPGEVVVALPPAVSVSKAPGTIPPSTTKATN